MMHGNITSRLDGAIAKILQPEHKSLPCPLLHSSSPSPLHVPQRACFDVKYREKKIPKNHPHFLLRIGL